MKRKLSPLQNLWILLSVQAALFLIVLGMFALFHPKLTHWISQAQQANAKALLVRQRIDQADPEHLHKMALQLLDDRISTAEYVQNMETSVNEMFRDICFVLFGITAWLGAILFQLHRAGTAPRIPRSD